jgi:hypothetical protein
MQDTELQDPELPGQPEDGELGELAAVGAELVRRGFGVGWVIPAWERP